MDPQREKRLLDMVVAYGDSFPLKDADGNQLVGGALALPNNNVQSLWERERTPSSERTSSSLQSELVSSEETNYTIPKYNLKTSDVEDPMH